MSQARRLIEGRPIFDPVSFHITGDHPTREIGLQDRELHTGIWQVSFPRGFEALLVNVYSNTCDENDAVEATLEFLEKNYPAALTAAEKEGNDEARVRKIAEAKPRAARAILAEFAAGAMPPRPDDLDAFTRAYIEALFSVEGGPDRPEINAKSISDLAPETLRSIVADCQKFQAENEAAIAEGSLKSGDNLTQAGHDFYLTRAETGAGFWDGDWDEPYATQLTDAAHAFGTSDIYVGDDGLIYAAGTEKPRGPGIEDVKVVDHSAPAPEDDAPDKATFDFNPEDDEDRGGTPKFESTKPMHSKPKPLHEAAKRVVDQLIAENFHADNAVEIYCPHCEAKQNEEVCRLGGLGNRMHYRCRQCGGDWNRSKNGPPQGDSPGD